MLKKLFILCAVTVSAGAHAHMHPDPGTVGIQAEWIYLKPSMDDPYIGQVPNSLQDPLDEQFRFGEFKATKFHHTSGYRGEAVYAFCNGENDARLRVTGLRAHNSRTVDAIFTQEFANLTPRQVPPQGPLQSISGKLTIDFLSVEATLGQKVYNCRPFYFSIGAGLNYVNFKSRQHLFLVSRAGETELQRYDDHFWGIGPELVLDFEYLCFSRLWCDRPVALMFVATFRESLLVGKEGPHFRDQSSVALPADWTSEKVWRVIPVEYLRAGFNLSSQINCMDISIEAGYEVMHYNKVLSVRRNAVSDLSFVDYTDVGMHGPYVALSVVF